MKMPAILRKKTVAAVTDEGEALIKSRSGLEAEIGDLDARRAELILDGEPDEIVSHDQSRARLAVRLEQVCARLARLDGEMVAAQEAEAEARRREAYDAAKKARGEGVAALATYEQGAKQAALSLVKLHAVEQQIATANKDLPEGVAPIPMAEPDNSRPMLADRPSRTMSEGSLIMSQHTPGRGHVSVRHRARIPSVKPDEMLFDGALL